MFVGFPFCVVRFGGVVILFCVCGILLHHVLMGSGEVGGIVSFVRWLFICRAFSASEFL